MTIAVKNSWFGNDIDATYERVEDVVSRMKSSPTYEVIPAECKVRPYGDLDGHIDDATTEEEFWSIHNLALKNLKEWLCEKSGRRTIFFSGSSYNHKKLSIRWCVPGVVLPSREHAKQFAEDLYSRIDIPAPFKTDYSVYSVNKKMRTLWTSKPGENRIFELLDDATPEETLITYIPPDAEPFEFELKKPEVPVRVSNVKCPIPLLKELCDCINVDAWTGYESCQSLIFTLLSLGAPAEFIHSQCSRASNYDFKWVNTYIQRYNPLKNKHTIGTLNYFAKKSNPEKYKVISSNEFFGKLAFEEITRLTTDENTLHDWCDETGKLKRIPIVPTCAVKSQLGTGKTYRSIEACQESPWNPYSKTILVISARQTFTSHITAELPGFVDYRDIKERQIPNDRVVIQLQSIHRIKDRTFDLVLLDESESILMCLSPNKTHKNYVETIKVFEKVIQSAKRVICLDAFLTDRTTNMLRALRGEVKVVINPHQPYKRTAEVYDDLEDYSSKLSKVLRQGKRTIGIWGAKKKGQEYHSVLPKTISNVFYSSESDAVEKAKHLANVNEYWAQYQYVSYTPTITIGINYVAEPQFDLGCMYATPWSCVSRDYIQALFRARALKDNHYITFIEKAPRPCSLEVGIEEQEREFKERNDRITKFLQDIGEPITDYSVLPEWLMQVLYWNRNEVVVNWKHFNSCMRGYFGLCGITATDYNHEGEQIKKKPNSKKYVSVSDVELIDYETAKTYKQARNVLTQQQKYELEKYYLNEKVFRIDQTIWELWLSDKKQVERCFSVLNRTPTDLIQYKVLELVPKDAERLRVVQDLNWDWTKQWTLKMEDVPQVNVDAFATRKQATKDTPATHLREVARAISEWCGADLSVKQKRVKVKGVCSYAYELVYSPLGTPFEYMVPN